VSFNYNAAVNITANFSGQGELKKANDSLKSIATSAGGLSSKFAGVTRALGGFAALFGAQQIISFGKSVIDLGDNLNDLRQKTGISVEALSGLKVAAETGGSSLEGLTSSLRKFSINSAEAGAGVRKAQEGFKALGIAVKNNDGTLKDSGSLILEVADRFSRMKDGPEKAAIATRLFGKAGAEMIPVLNQGRQELEKYAGAFSSAFATNADQFNDNLTILKLNTQSFTADLLSQTLPALNAVTSAFIDITKSSGETGEEMGALDSIIRAVGFAIIAVFERGMAVIDVFKAGVKELATVVGLVINQFGSLGKLFGDLIKNFGNFKATQDSFSRFTDSSKQNFQDFSDESKAIGKDLSDTLSKRFKAAGDAYEKIFSGKSDLLTTKTPGKPGGDTFTPDLKKVDTGEDTRRQRELNQIRDLQIELQELVAIKDLEARRVSMTAVEYQKEMVAIKESTKAKKETNDLLEENRAAYEEVTQKIIEQKQALLDQEQAQRQSFGVGAQEALRDYLETARDVASATKNAFSNAFRGMEDAFVSFVQTGKFNFADLARSIEADLIRIAYRQLIVNTLSSALGSVFGGAGAVAAPVAGTSSAGLAFGGLGGNFAFAKGGIMTKEGPVPLRAYARGGIANSPQAAIFGEGSTPEAFVPLPDGRRIPVAMQGGGAGGTSVVVNVNIQSDGSAEENSKAQNQQGKALGELISSTVKQTLIQEKRPGGLLAV
jgi:lambda family phage tail tape measure protein